MVFIFLIINAIEYGQIPKKPNSYEPISLRGLSAKKIILFLKDKVIFQENINNLPHESKLLISTLEKYPTIIALEKAFFASPLDISFLNVIKCFGIENSYDDCGKTILSNKILNRKNNDVSFLIDNDFDINFPDADGTTPLMHAVETGQKKIVKMLLQRGANVNIQNMLGFTALMRGILNNQYDIIRILLQKGADINFKSWADQTALSLAQDFCQKKTEKLLLQYGAHQ
ncbi:MAG: ankyrin repeat domain-containing protein [Candidatus Babeliales bacterium]